jgi:hypothetical protein
MSNTKHNPGPWKYIAWHGQHGVHDAMDNDVCETFGEDAQANARVIAAAPDLLEACIEALSLFDNYPACWEAIGTYEVLSNAIAKAKARQG